MKTLTSPHNPLIKHLLKLKTDKKYRTASQTLLLEGKILVNEYLARHTPIHVLLTDPSLLTRPVNPQLILQITPGLLNKLSDVKTPEGILAEVPLPPEGNFDSVRRLLAFDGISDPGNMGTLLRTALAFGWEGVFLLENSCDPFSSKALRAAKGATFYLPLRSGNWDALEKIVKKNGLNPVAADIAGTPADSLKVKSNILLVLGNESSGLSPETKSRCQIITLPMPGNTESLNVSVAGGILMYLLKP